MHLEANSSRQLGSQSAIHTWAGGDRHWQDENAWLIAERMNARQRGGCLLSNGEKRGPRRGDPFFILLINCNYLIFGASSSSYSSRIMYLLSDLVEYTLGFVTRYLVDIYRL